MSSLNHRTVPRRLFPDERRPTMRLVLSAVLTAAFTLLVMGVVIFHYSVGLPWLDAIYFVVTTMTTVGYGDINLQGTSPTIKLFGTFLMFAGAASMAALFGIITDTILRSRLQEFLGKRSRPMKDHVVLCGLGNVGYRVLEQLHKLGKQVVVIEDDEDCRFFDDARKLGARVINGDIRYASSLEQADIRAAECLIAVTDQDLANLEAALNARSANEGIRIVMRLFDQNLANKVREGFDIDTAFSTSALAAPAFAMAAVDSTVVGSFYVGDDLMLNLDLTVRAGSRLDGITTQQLEKMGHMSILAHESATTGRRVLHPAEPHILGPEDKLVVSTLPEFARKIHELNKPV